MSSQSYLTSRMNNFDVQSKQSITKPSNLALRCNSETSSCDTTRGKRFASKSNVQVNIFLLTLLLCVVFAFSGAVSTSEADSGSVVQEVTSYTVRPGDSLWTYAQMVTTDGGDITKEVANIMELNNLQSPVLYTGQRIVVPKV
jgi:LysM repeat protein